MVRQELRHRELRFEFDRAAACLAAFLCKDLRIGLEVHQSVSLFEIGQFVFHLTEFATDKCNTAVDEACRALCHTVLVVHHIALVGIEHLIEHILCASTAHVAAGDDDERAFLVIFGCTDTSLINIGCYFLGQTCYANFLFCRKLSIGGIFHKAQSTHGSGYHFAHTHFLFARNAFTVLHKVRQTASAGIDDGHIETDGSVGLLLEFHFKGALTIKRYIMKTLLRGVIDVKFQTVDHTLHQTVRGKDENFVLQVISHTDTVEFEQVAHIAASFTRTHARHA